MNFIQGFHCLQFNENPVLHEKIRNKISDDLTIVEDLDRELLFDFQSCLVKFVGQSVFIDLFQKPVSQAI